MQLDAAGHGEEGVPPQGAFPGAANANKVAPMWLTHAAYIAIIPRVLNA